MFLRYTGRASMSPWHQSRRRAAIAWSFSRTSGKRTQLDQARLKAPRHESI